MSNTVVAVLFGGRSCEHEVSILTAHEAMSVLKSMPGYEVVPVYITKDGRFLTGAILEDLDKFAKPETLEAECKPLVFTPMAEHPIAIEGGRFASKPKPIPVDVVLPVMHGPNGEDGTLQGMIEMLGLPYAGSGVLASALCMDKVAMKQMFAAAGIPQMPFVTITRAEWAADRAAQVAKSAAMPHEALFVKPARGGSSIGVTMVSEEVALADAIELAFAFDENVVVEVAATGAVEVNCAVMRTVDGLVTSALEKVEADGGFLTYDQKYLQWSKGAPAKTPGGSAAPAGAKGVPVDATGGHEVPAKLPEHVAEKVRSLAKASFDACSCDGMGRIDFLVRGDEVFVNEINTLPGSMAFYLWEAAGIGFDQMLRSLIDAAIASAKAKNALTYCLDRNLLADIEARKGQKTGRS